MSKAKIIKHLGDGKYKVFLITDVETLKARIEILENKIKEINGLVAGVLQDDINNSLAALISITIPPGVAIDSPELANIMASLVSGRSNYDLAIRAMTLKKMELENSNKEIVELKRNNDEAEKERDIWCADYNTKLKENDIVGVIDWFQFRERSTPAERVIIPGYINHKESFYLLIRDGVMALNAGLKPYSWWYAMMLVSGMERFNPHYRKAEIKVINNDGTVNVKVDEIYTQALRSNAKSLSQNEINLNNVPVKYLTCDAGAFLVGDRVVLEYPRKDIHKELAENYKSSRTALQNKTVDINQEINDLQNNINDSNNFIGLLRAQLDVLISDLNTILNDPGSTEQLKETAYNEVDEAQGQIINEERELTKIESRKFNVMAQLNDVEQQINILSNLEQQELSNSEVIKAYKAKRPKEITVVGFVEKPRPCRGIAFQDFNGNWKIVRQNGKESPLAEPPSVIGRFNWGSINEKGLYPDACVWDSTRIRTGGYDYMVGGPILSCGIIADTPSEGITTLKVIIDQPADAPTRLEIKTITVRAGDILSTKSNMLGGTIPVLKQRMPSIHQPTNQDLYNSSDVLVDKSGLFAIAASCSSRLPGGIYTGISTSVIYLIDLISFTSEIITVASEYPDIFIYQHDTLSYDNDGNIILIAKKDGDIIIHPSDSNRSLTSEFYYEFKYNSGSLLKEKKVYTNTYDVNYTTLGEQYYRSNRALSYVVDDNSMVLINMLKSTDVINGVGSVHDQDKIDTYYNEYRVQTSTQFIVFVDFPRVDGDFTGAFVDGYSAGCLKIRSDSTDALWLEYRGNKSRLTDKPSVNYTILI